MINFSTFTRLWSQARTQILVWYAILTMSSTVGAILAIRYTLFLELEDRIEASLRQEIEEFERLKADRNLDKGKPLAEDIATLFDVFLSHNVPGDDEFFFTVLDQRFYDASSRALPQILQPDSPLVKRWEQTTQKTFGQDITSNGTVVYLTHPVSIKGQVKGLVVVAHITTGERQEVSDVIIVVTQVMLMVLVIASILAWLTAGRILEPLQSLTKAARIVSESDLTQRIAVQGSGEVSDLTHTFNDMMDRLEKAFTSQRKFTSDLGHELRTPITIIRGHLELMGDDPQEQHETLTLVIDELDRMSGLVNDLILLSKAEQPSFLRLKSIALDSFTTELYAKVQALAPRQWQLDAVAHGQICCDPYRLTQAVINLAHNATQHTTPADRISLGTVIADGQVRIWIQDTGEGIAPEDQHRIFKRFTRAHHKLRTSDGSGLGLAIVESIAQAHGGNVQLQSSLGTGSTFTLVLPIYDPLKKQ